MSAPNPAAVAPEKKPSRTGYRIGFATVGTLVLLILLLLPFSVGSILTTVLRPPNDSLEDVTSWSVNPTDGWADLIAVEIVAFDEIQQIVTLRVSGLHLCHQNCTYKDRVTLYSVTDDPEVLAFTPVSESITLSADRTEVIARFQFPMEGNLIHYPFDRYTIRLAVRVEREFADGTVTELTPEDLENHLLIMANEAIPRLGLNPPEIVDLAPYWAVPFEPKYGFISLLTLERPDYLKVLVVSVVLLIGAAASYAVFMRPFDQLIINAGALVLGVWGARTMLLGSYPPDVTAVDTALTTIILLLLLSISFRVLNYLHLKAGLSIFPWVKVPAPPSESAPPAAAGESAPAPGDPSDRPAGTPPPRETVPARS